MSHSWLKRAEESNNGLFSVMSGDCEFACLGLGVVNWLTFDAILNEIGPSDVQKHSHMTQKWMLLHCLSLLTFSTENDSWHFHNWPLCAFLLHKWQEMPSDTVYVWHLIQCELKTTHGEHFSVSNATVQFHVTLLELPTQTFTTYRAQKFPATMQILTNSWCNFEREGTIWHAIKLFCQKTKSCSKACFQTFSNENGSWHGWDWPCMLSWCTNDKKWRVMQVLHDIWCIVIPLPVFQTFSNENGSWHGWDWPSMLSWFTNELSNTGFAWHLMHCEMKMTHGWHCSSHSQFKI